MFCVYLYELIYCATWQVSKPILRREVTFRLAVMELQRIT